MSFTDDEGYYSDGPSELEEQQLPDEQSWQSKYDATSEKAIRGKNAETNIQEGLFQEGLEVEDTWQICKHGGMTVKEAAKSTKLDGDMVVKCLSNGKTVNIEVKSTLWENGYFPICEVTRTSFCGKDKLYCLALTAADGFIETVCFVPSWSLQKYLGYKDLKVRQSDGWKYRLLPTKVVKEQKLFTAVAWSYRQMVEWMKKGK